MAVHITGLGSLDADVFFKTIRTLHPSTRQLAEIEAVEKVTRDRLRTIATSDEPVDSGLAQPRSGGRSDTNDMSGAESVEFGSQETTGLQRWAKDLDADLWLLLESERNLGSMPSLRSGDGGQKGDSLVAFDKDQLVQLEFSRGSETNWEIKIDAYAPGAKVLEIGWESGVVQTVNLDLRAGLNYFVAESPGTLDKPKAVRFRSEE